MKAVKKRKLRSRVRSIFETTGLCPPPSTASSSQLEERLWTRVYQIYQNWVFSPGPDLLCCGIAWWSIISKKNIFFSRNAESPAILKMSILYISQNLKVIEKLFLASLKIRKIISSSMVKTIIQTNIRKMSYGVFRPLLGRFQETFNILWSEEKNVFLVIFW